MNCGLSTSTPIRLNPPRALVMKAQPMVLFMNLMFQQTVIPRPRRKSRPRAGFVPRTSEENYNH